MKQETKKSIAKILEIDGVSESIESRLINELLGSDLIQFKKCVDGVLTIHRFTSDIKSPGKELYSLQYISSPTFQLKFSEYYENITLEQYLSYFDRINCFEDFRRLSNEYSHQMQTKVSIHKPSRRSTYKTRKKKRLEELDSKNSGIKVQFKELLAEYNLILLHSKLYGVTEEAHKIRESFNEFMRKKYNGHEFDESLLASTVPQDVINAFLPLYTLYKKSAHNKSDKHYLF